MQIENTFLKVSNLSKSYKADAPPVFEGIDFEIEKGKTYNEKLRELAYAGFEKLGIQETEELKERVEYELNIIIEKGYSPYFLVVGDLLRHAKENGIQEMLGYVLSKNSRMLNLVSDLGFQITSMNDDPDFQTVSLLL